LNKTIKNLSIDNIIKEYRDDIKEVDHEWWIFRNISHKHDYPIFMAHAEEIGYKRGARKEEKRLNQLFCAEGDYFERKIIVNVKDPKTIIDHLRKTVIWN